MSQIYVEFEVESPRWASLHLLPIVVAKVEDLTPDGTATIYPFGYVPAGSIIRARRYRWIFAADGSTRVDLDDWLPYEDLLEVAR